MELNLYTVVITMVNFFILYLILKSFLFKPVLDFINNRTKSIEEQLNETKYNHEKSEALRMEYEKKLDDAEDKGREILDKYKQEADSVSEEIILKAKYEAKAIREKAINDAAGEMERAKEGIKKQIVTISILAASKAINKEIDEKKHHDMIMDFIDKVGI